MSNKQDGADKSGFQLALDDGGGIARRATGFLPDGAYLFEDALAFTGELTANVITGAVWLLELYELTAGELVFISGAAAVRPRTRCFGVFYAPFTISQPCFKHAAGRLIGVAANAPVPAEFLTGPCVFDTTCA